MTAAQMIAELEKIKPDTEVWVDTAEGLMSVDGLYGIKGDVNTAIITYANNEYKEILN